MPNPKGIPTPKKIDIEQTAANTTKSYKMEADYPQYKNYNADHITAIVVQIDDFDAIADGDWWKIQLSYDDQNGATLHTKSNILEIETIGQDFKVLGTNGPIVVDVREVAEKGVVFFLNNCYIVYPEFWINFDTAGQDAAEIAHCEVYTEPELLLDVVIKQLKAPSAVR